MHFDQLMNDGDSVIGARASGHKQLTCRILGLAGVPVPKNILVSTAADAITAAHQLGFPVVVKPDDANRSEGVTVGIASDEDLINAFKGAGKFSKRILIEEQIPGTCHRIQIANNRFYWAMKRHPPLVEGDGVHTIRELVDIENSKEEKLAKHKRQPLLLLDDIAIELISAAGFSPGSVLQKGVRAPLRKLNSLTRGSFREMVTETIHPENISLAIHAASLLRLNLAGVDVISTDISRPWHESGAVINEINSGPMWTLSVEALKDAQADYLRDVFPTQGRIPIEVFVGDEEAMRRAAARQIDLVDEGTRCFLSSHTATYGPAGENRFAFPAGSLFLRCQALLMNRDVDAVILTVQTDEFVQKGLPIDSINRIEVVNESLSSVENEDEPAKDGSFKKLIELLHTYLV
jgi:cyanophycin synthetase